MPLEQKLLIVADPTASRQIAIERVMERILDNQPNYKPEISILFTADVSVADANSENGPQILSQDELASLLEPFNGQGITPRVLYSWSGHWAASVLECADQEEVTTIIVANPGKTANRHISDEFWDLIRHTKVPLGIIQEQPPQKGNRKILVSMDLSDNKIQDLNHRMFEVGKASAELFGAELHLAYVYRNSTDYPNRGKMVELTELPNDNIHLKSGEPDEALPEIANEVAPNQIIIGATRRTGIRAAMRGRKIGQMLKNINFDLVVVA